MLLEGIFVPLTTPFYPDGRLYLRKLEHNVDRYSRTPAAGMLVLARSGEPDSLTDSEMRETLETAIAAAADDKVMVAGCGRESVFATLQLAEAASGAGYDAIGLRAPIFSADLAMRAELLTYFRAVADRSALPVVLFSRAERPLAVDVIGALSQHGNIVAAVEDRMTAERMARLREATAGCSREVTVTPVFSAVTGRMLRGKEPAAGNFVPAESLAGGMALAAAQPVAAIKTRTKRVGFQLLAGSAGTMLSAWRAGAAGAAPRFAACAPQACCEVWQAFKDGDLQLAEEKQLRILAIGEKVEGWSGIPAVKHACDLNGYFGGRPRLPLIPLNAAQREELEREMAGIRN
jgi:dihydrodipicolinate synthase/N-acetylneuraminate lyase